jgi:hypothetical protein
MLWDVWGECEGDGDMLWGVWCECEGDGDMLWDVRSEWRKVKAVTVKIQTVTLISKGG